MSEYKKTALVLGAGGFIGSHMDGNLSKDEMTDQAKASTRQLAKRQLTWLRSWRADTNTFIEVSKSIPFEKGKAWLSGVLDRVL